MHLRLAQIAPEPVLDSSFTAEVRRTSIDAFDPINAIRRKLHELQIPYHLVEISWEPLQEGILTYPRPSYNAVIRIFVPRNVAQHCANLLNISEDVIDYGRKS